MCSILASLNALNSAGDSADGGASMATVPTAAAAATPQAATAAATRGASRPLLPSVRRSSDCILAARGGRVGEVQAAATTHGQGVR
jgi:hypothetical protein